jgi:hypothetical protein
MDTKDTELSVTELQLLRMQQKLPRESQPSEPNRTTDTELEELKRANAALQQSGLNTPTKFTHEYNGKEKTYKDESKVTLSVGVTSLTRPSPIRREFKPNFNAQTVTGASPREVS